MTFPDGLTRLFRATAFSFLSILAIQNAALAQAPAADPWDGTPLTADPRAVLDAAQKVPTDDAAVVVLLDEDRYSFDSQGRATTARHLVYRIVNESAVDEWSTVQALWAPWYQEKPQIQARVITKDGEVRVLDPKAISDAPAPEESLDIFSDNRT